MTVQVTSVNPVIGVVTDEAGRYVLPAVPLGRQQFSYGSAGYQPAVIPEVLVTAGKEVVLDVALEQKLVTLDALTITAPVTRKGAAANEFTAGSARSFSLEEVTRYAGGRNDPSKLVSNYAGVAANSDARNDIVVRGNSPTGVLWRMEGSPSPNPNHFSALGTTGGPVSALNTNALKASDFLTGAFSAEYGNAVAAVFDINLRSGNSSKHEQTIQLNTFSGVEATIEGPLNHKNNGAAYLASYRYSFAQIANSIGLNIGTKATPKYQDWVFNVTTGNSGAGKFSFFGMGGWSNIALLGSKVDSTDFYGQADQDGYDKSNFSIFGVKHTLDLGNRTYLRTVVSYAHTIDAYDEYRYPDPVPPYESRWLHYSSKNTTSTFRVSTYLNSKVNSRLSYRVGATTESLGLDVRILDKTSRPAAEPFDTVSNYNGTPFLVQYFGQLKYRVSEQFSILGGLHGMHFDVNNSATLEPRLSLAYQLPARQSVSLSYGLHSQLQPLPVYFQQMNEMTGERNPGNRDLGFTRAHHFVLAYEKRFLPDWRIKAEFYYQHLFNVPVERQFSGFSMLNAGADFGFPNKVGLVNKGTGNNRGVELTAEKFLSRGYYFLFTASIFDSKYRGSDDVERNTAFNYKRVFNMLTGKEWKVGRSGNNAFTFDARLSSIGGRYTTPVNVPASVLAGYQILDTLHYNSQQLDGYFRLDVKLGFRTNSKKHKLTQTFYLDLQNVTNRKNIFLVQYNQAKGIAEPVYQIRFFPDILYRVQF
ncbi:TonB-dependent receptor plug domain-containing protein [Flavitalea sp. BT771]|uniref:carboxypeptidase regulatory-like domain-containing protein n=1 Tax=Flavitalea sp. BT771 TaxID=3063329 RepID=UPI0026E1E315|nr:carboxypeptidase regulatory-like domain-containing protein [Flavitalea sp. BT771]MDO6434735.1 TonB-dependent receptor plug domain-containing protein [Flavitalea sp. BT771]MDV6223635.1 TonB-dependent receptor plug domain-containing protein [Flavitalea sp. BT771]